MDKQPKPTLYILSGRTTDPKGQALQNLTIRAYDRDLASRDDFLGEATTNEDGRYLIRFSDEQFQSTIKESGPDVFIRVFDRNDQLLGESPVRRNAKKRISISLKVDVPVGAKPLAPEFTISGIVRQSNGRPLDNARVRAFDQGLRQRRISLGEGKSDSGGRYVIRYDQDKLLDAARGSANLSLEVIGRGGAVLAKSEIKFNAGRNEIANLTIDEANLDKRSEFERLDTILNEHLNGEPPDSLTREEIEFLVKSTTLDAKRIEFAVQAYQLSQSTVLPVAVHYALLRNRLPADLPKLLKITPEDLVSILQKAVARNIIPNLNGREIDALQEQFQTLQADDRLGQSLGERQSTLGELLESAGISRGKQRLFATQLDRARVHDADYWQSIEESGSLEKIDREKIEFFVRVGDITDNRPRVVTALLRKSDTYSIEKLAKELVFEDWKEIVRDHVSEDDLPGDVPGKSASERKLNHARRIYSRMQALFPKTSVLHSLPKRLPSHSTAPWLPKIAEKVADFDFRTADLRSTLEKHGEELGINARERSAVAEKLQGLQRIYRLQPDVEAVGQLIEDGIDSAQAILRQGRTKFIEKFGKGEVLGREAAEELYDNAEHVAAKAMVIFTRFSPLINNLELPTLVAEEYLDSLKQIPDFETLFGSFDQCVCRPCLSVYSQPAYLTDLLAFLDDEAMNAGGVKALDKLKKRDFLDRNANLIPGAIRRPDLLDIELSCENAETTIPYVDLALEILENAVAPPSNFSPQTTRTADQLGTYPEHFNQAAYDALKNAVYPFGFPFDLQAEERTLYLERLGSSLHELQETFAPLTQEVFESEEIAASVLGLTKKQFDLVCAKPAAVDADPPEFWGFKPKDTGWPAKLKVVEAFIKRAGLEYSDLSWLLALRSVNPDSRLNLEFEDPSICDPERIKITQLDENVLDYMHRFLRLQRSLGWSLLDLDRAVVALAEDVGHNRPNINSILLRRLASLRRLQNDLAVPFNELLTWWADIDTSDYEIANQPVVRSHFYSLFLSGVQSQPGHSAFELDDDGRLAQQDLTYSDERLSKIASAFQHSVSDVLALQEGVLDGQGSTLTLAGLSKLFRHHSLAKALTLTIPDYLRIRRLAGEPFPDNPVSDPIAQTLHFIDRVKQLENSPFSIAEADYILRQTIADDDNLSPTKEKINQFLEKLDNELATVTSDTSEGETEARASRIYQNISGELDLEVKMCRFLIEHLIPDAYQTLTNGLGNDAKQSVYIHLHKISLIVNRLKITAEEIEEIHRIYADPETGTDQVRWLDLTKLPIAEDAAAADFNALIRLVQLIQFRDGLVEHHRHDWFGLLNVGFNYLNQQEPLPSPTTSARLEYCKKLAEMSLWNVEEIKIFVGLFNSNELSHGDPNGILKTRFPQDFADERLLVRLQACFKLLNRLGVKAEQAATWSEGATMPGHIEVLKQTLVSKYDQSQWFEVAKQLRDPLRETQRKALVNHLVHQWNLSGPNDLFDHFLIDVEMSPCQMTTRIGQAINTVQLFIQRIFLNLEPSVALTDDGAAQWQWMKNYRTWEANRKVFLYPENWIEPELRDDKTPFFKDLENELLQNEISNEVAEKAYLTYLEKLHEVARLQVCGSYLEEESGVLHIFARTRNIPHHYYHRKGYTKAVRNPGKYNDSWVYDFAVDGVSSWSAWKKVNVDIEGDMLTPVVHNGRIYLFWPIFSEEDDSPFHKIESQLNDFMGKIVEFFSLFLNLATRTSVYLAEGLQDLINGIIDGLNKQLESIRKNPATTLFALEPIPSIQIVENIKESLGELTGSPPSEEEIQAVFQTFVTIFQDTSKLYIALIPAKRREIQLAWSEFKNGQWSAKKTSAGKLQFRDEVTTLFAPLFTTASHLSEADESENNADAQDGGKFDATRLFTFRGYVNSEKDPEVEIYYPSPSFDEDGELSFASERIGSFAWEPSSGLLDIQRIKSVIQIEFPESNAGFNGVAAIFRTLQGLSKYKTGEPITPDDDHEYPSDLRESLDDYLPNPSTYRLFALQQFMPNGQIQIRKSFFYSDVNRTFYCHGDLSQTHFEPFYHPYTAHFIQSVSRHGIDGLLNSRFEQHNSEWVESSNGEPLQVGLGDADFFREPDYDPVDHINPKPVETVDFSPNGSYSQYNWELFFHIPFMIACQLMTNRKFNEAQKWFHYIFDPTDSSAGQSPKKYWRTKPFATAASSDYQKEQIQRLLKLVSDQAEEAGEQELESEVLDWRDNAFNPFLVARARTTTFQKAVVMKYIENLIEWGDSLFRRGSLEAVNEATQMYVLAEKLLGSKPKEITNGVAPDKRSYHTLTQTHELDEFSNTLVEIETRVRHSTSNVNHKTLRRRRNAWQDLLNGATLSSLTRPVKEAERLFFCVPKNEQLTAYWNTVADRLFKIRHCMDIAGRMRQWPLFGAPIDPAILVRAMAEGVDIDSLLNDLYAPLPHYRFTFLSQKATELCNELKSLGSALLSALEKRDAEELSLIRSNQEMELLEAVKEIKTQQIQDAEHNLQGLQYSRDVIENRQTYYTSRPFLNIEETAHLTLTAISQGFRDLEGLTRALGAAVGTLPNIKIGAVTTIGAETGGASLNRGIAGAADVLSAFASRLSFAASTASTMGGYRRRAEDWAFQAESAAGELKNIDEQIQAAEIRLAIAKKDLENQELQITNSQKVNEYIQDKFTNQSLYHWMVTQVSALYFQTYQLAFDLAKQCEQAYRFELGVEDSSFIKANGWDSLKKGLLAGEHLSYQLKRMEVAYLNTNRRELELTKHISLALTEPAQLLELKQTGRCTLALHEKLFDADYPGHYMRRIKSVAITIPCVKGPYTNINCRLNLVSSKIRIKELPGEEDERFQTRSAAVESIVTSHAQRDSGTFELNFRDERYLPFEGAGVISTWEIELDRLHNVFDFGTVTDVILHIQYTAREGGQTLRDWASTRLQAEAVAPVMLSAKHDFSSEWHRFLRRVESVPSQILEVGLTPPLIESNTKIERLDVFLLLREDLGGSLQFSFSLVEILDEDNINTLPNLDVNLKWDSTYFGSVDFSPSLNPGKLQLSIDPSNLPSDLTETIEIGGNSVQQIRADKIEDLFLLVHSS